MKKIFRITVITLTILALCTGCAGKKNSGTVSKNEIKSSSKEATTEQTVEIETTFKEEITEETAETTTEETIETTTENSTEETTEEITVVTDESETESTQTNQYVGEDTQDSDSEGVGLDSYDEIKLVDVVPSNDKSQVEKIAKEIIAEIITDGMSDFDKAKAIHDYMVINIDYDYDDYLAGTIPYDSYEVKGALVNKYAVCAGYAKTFNYLCQLADLECIYVTGKARGYHAWNQVKIDGNWYNVDVTWDDPVNLEKKFDDHRFNKYEYFLVSDAEFTDHEAYSTVNICNNSLRNKAYELGMPWHADITVKNTADIQTVVKEAVSNNSGSMIMVWDKTWLTMDEMKEALINALYAEKITPDYSFVRRIYSTYDATNYIRVEYVLELNNGVYTKLNLSETIEAFQEQLATNVGWEKKIYFSSSLNDTNTLNQVLSYVYDQKDICVDIVTNKKLNDVVSFIKVNSYAKGENVKNATVANSLVETEELIKAFAKDYAGNCKYITYNYKSDLGNIQWSEASVYIDENITKWENTYCVEVNQYDIRDEICRITFEFTEAVHTYGDWVKIQDANCVNAELWHQLCEDCGRLLDTIENPANGIHDGYWVYIDDCTRQVKCHNCSYVGNIETKFGDIWGYFDFEQAKELLAYVNVKRESALHYNMDDFGNLISVETPPQLVEDTVLNAEAMTILASFAAGDTETVAMYNDNYQALYISGSTKASYAYSWLFENSTGRRLLNDKQYDIAGVSCFYFDKDGTGLNMVPMWCVKFGTSN